MRNLYAFFISRRVIGSYGPAALLVALTVGAAFVFRRLPHANLPLLFLTVVLVIAARFGLWPSIFASVLSFLALNFFFTEPRHTFAVEEQGDLVTLLFFLAMAALTGNLAARMRSESAQNRAAQLESETERLRSALLASVSHDLKTPLAAIIGSTSSLLEYQSILKPGDREELLRNVLAEAERLNRYIQNLLDMTRFGQRPFAIDRQWHDLNDLISSAVERLGAALGQTRLKIDVATDAALLHVQGALLEQVFVNLLDNAAGFAPADSVIEVSARQEDVRTIIEVANDGPVIPEDERERIFELFHRASQRDRQRPGTGLGLAICRSIVAAHGGTIEARAGASGTLIRITLPAEAKVDRVSPP